MYMYKSISYSYKTTSTLKIRDNNCKYNIVQYGVLVFNKN